jgi:hypothetical protein
LRQSYSPVITRRPGDRNKPPTTLSASLRHHKIMASALSRPGCVTILTKGISFSHLCEGEVCRSARSPAAVVKYRGEVIYTETPALLGSTHFTAHEQRGAI